MCPSHGALSKAGKVRDLFRSDVASRFHLKRQMGLVTKKGNPLKHNKRHKHPRLNNKAKYRKYMILNKPRSNKGSWY